MSDVLCCQRNSCAELLKMLQKTNEEFVLSKIRANKWYKAFKGGQEVFEDLLRSGHPSISSTEGNTDKQRNWKSSS